MDYNCIAVVVHVRATGDAPILKQSKFRVCTLVYPPLTLILFNIIIRL